MSLHTANLEEIIKHELIKKGFNEFYNDGHLTFNDGRFRFIQKMIRFDDDVKHIVDDVFFKGYKFKDKKIDHTFKKTFINRFLNREINRQTFEDFASQVIYVTLTHEDYIKLIFSDEIKHYFENHSTTDTEDLRNLISQVLQDENSTNNRQAHHDDTSVSITENREAQSTLPQDEINLNVDHDELTFADNNTISKNQNTSKNQSDDDSINHNMSDSNTSTAEDTHHNQTVLNKNYQLDSLSQLFDMKERLFNQYDKKCFLQIW